MFSRLIDIVSGKDDLERIACKGDLDVLNKYLKTRRLLIPGRPKRFLDASGLTADQLLELIRNETEDLAGGEFEPWVLEVDGERRLPAFSSQKKMEVFTKKLSQEMNKVFALGGAEALIDEIKERLTVDFIDLNLFSKNSWEIGMK